MGQTMVSNEVALRIGIAAHTLPDTSVRELIDALQLCLGDSIDETSLARITVTNLKESLKGTYNLDGEEDGSESPRSEDIAAFKEAVRVLWGESSDPNLPAIEPYRDGDMPHSVRIAIASNEAERLDGHFGSCLRFLVYQVSADEIRLVDIRPTLSAESAADKNGFRVSLINDCAVVYVVSLGGPAAAKVIKADIHISQHENGGDARPILAQLQDVLRGNPPPWLRKLTA